MIKKSFYETKPGELSNNLFTAQKELDTTKSINKQCKIIINNKQRKDDTLELWDNDPIFYCKGNLGIDK